MTRLRRAWSWLFRRRRRTSDAALREFVYLDDISVYSLLASRSGPVATEFTRTESESLSREGSAGLRLDLTPSARAEVRGRRERTRTTGSQVLAKSSAQARFGQLLLAEEERMLLRAQPRGRRPAFDGNAADLRRLTSDREHRDWVLSQDALARGAMVELEVQLEAEEIYQVAEAMTSVLEILKEDPELFGVTDRLGLREATAVTRMLEQLLVELIPIRARSTSHSVVCGPNWQIVAHNELLDELGAHIESALKVEPLHVVGVTDANLYWKSIRRVLFSQHRYLTLCRIAREGLQQQWTPIGLAEVLRGPLPEVAEALDAAGAGLLSALRSSSTGDEAEPRAEFDDVIYQYAVELGRHLGDAPTRGDLEADGLLPVGTDVPTTLDERRAMLAPVEEWLASRSGQPLSADVAADVRSRLLMADVHAADSSDQLAPPRAGPAARQLLECEFIAVYW